MRIGTWNLAGRWSDARAEFLTSLECDILLLTEVHHETRVPGMRGRTTYGLMAPDRFWAGVFSSGAQIGLPRSRIPPRPWRSSTGSPAAARCCPWRSCGTGSPVGGGAARRQDRRCRGPDRQAALAGDLGRRLEPRPRGPRPRRQPGRARAHLRGARHAGPPGADGRPRRLPRRAEHRPHRHPQGVGAWSAPSRSRPSTAASGSPTTTRTSSARG